jgi:1,2-phenylacetyl-CoA epoxidase catalytic subunit
LRNHTNDDNFQQVNSNLGSWLGLVDAIDEEVEEWMKFVIDHVNEAWELYSFVEDLLGHVKSKPDRVADTYVHLLDRQKYPDYPQDKIVELVESLYLNDVAKKACTICNKYLKAGYKFLIPVFQRHQQQ